MPEESLSGVVLKENLARVQRSWVFRLIFTNLFYIIVLVGLSLMTLGEKKEISSRPNVERIVEEYRTKDKLYGILRSKGYSAITG